MGKNGFTLIEVILAIFILTVGVAGSFVLIQHTLVSAFLNQSKLTAYYLAQEGVEIIRNARDNNFLAIHYGVEGAGWDDDIRDACPSPKISPCDFYGDVNFDGAVTQTDVSLLNQYIGGLEEFTEEQIDRGDLNDSGSVNIADQNLLSQYISCTRDKFPVCDTDSLFQREVAITMHGGDPDILEVLSRVTWQERGRSHEAEVLEYIYNWYGQ